MRISDWSSDVCSSDLWRHCPPHALCGRRTRDDGCGHRELTNAGRGQALLKLVPPSFPCRFDGHREQRLRTSLSQNHHDIVGSAALGVRSDACGQTGGEFVQEWFAVPIGSERGGKIRTLRGTHHGRPGRSEEHTSELQSLMRISYAVFCLKKKTTR